MNTPISPWINLMLHQAQRYHRLTWFLYGWMEREQVLNEDAFVAWWGPRRCLSSKPIPGLPSRWPGPSIGVEMRTFAIRAIQHPWQEHLSSTISLGAGHVSVRSWPASNAHQAFSVPNWMDTSATVMAAVTPAQRVSILSCREGLGMALQRKACGNARTDAAILVKCGNVVQQMPRSVGLPLAELANVLLCLRDVRPRRQPQRADAGGYGYIADHGMERFYRDVRLFRLYEGTSQIHQLDIVRRTLALAGQGVMAAEGAAMSATAIAFRRCARSGFRGP